MIILDASLSREVLVGGPPWFGDIEMCPLDFGNDLLLLIYVYILPLLILACLDVS